MKARILKVVIPGLILVLWFGMFDLALSHNANDIHSSVNINPDSSGQSAGFPVEVGGDFALIDHNGKPVTNDSFRGRHMLVFFGYVNCKNMCSLSLTRIGKALEMLGPLAEKLVPLVITVDPVRDTPEVLNRELAKFHPGLIGLTGKPDEIAMAYKAYQQVPRQVENDWDGDSVISHSSYFYLMDREGKFQTLFPPILNPQSMANIIRKYISDIKNGDRSNDGTGQMKGIVANLSDQEIEAIATYLSSL